MIVHLPLRMITDITTSSECGFPERLSIAMEERGVQNERLYDFGCGPIIANSAYRGMSMTETTMTSFHKCSFPPKNAKITLCALKLSVIIPTTLCNARVVERVK